MACSFGEIDPNEGNIEPLPAPGPGADPSGSPTDEPGDTQDPQAGPIDRPSDDPVEAEEPYDPENDLFASPLGQETKEILQTYCGDCHIGAGASGDFGYLLNIQALIDGDKLVPGAKEDSQIYNRMVGGTMPPAFYRAANGIPTYGQIDTVGKFIDELELPDPNPCDPLQFMDVDSQIVEMQSDLASLDPVTEQPFTRYMTINYSRNAGDCGRALQRQRYALFKGINGVSTNPIIKQPVAIDQDETIYRIDIRDYNWDRDIDLEDDGVVDFADGWDAIVADPFVDEFMIEYQGDNADDLKADTGTAVPFMPVNAFIQATQFGDLYYTLIGGRANLFVFEREVLGIDTVEEIANDRLMRAGFANSGVSKQERVLNRFDSGVAGGLNYWISFDFDGGGGGEVEGEFVQNLANESIFDDPINFAFAGGEAIFSLPNGLQAYYVANAAGTRLATAPIGVVIDPAQNNGLVVNGASCNSCHNAGMITFTDTVRQYVESNPRFFSNDEYEAVMAQYVDATTFQAAMDRDSAVHVSALERAGVPKKVPDAISRLYLDFQLGNITLELAAGELGVAPEDLARDLDLLDPSLGTLSTPGGYVDRDIFGAVFLDSVCILQNAQDNIPVGCP
jgi:serine/threonine-protein kinase